MNADSKSCRMAESDLQSGSTADPLRIGIAGSGRQAVFHLQRLGLREDARVVALCDADDPEHGKAWNGDARFARSREEFMADPEIELAFVCAPLATRAAIACDLLQAGKHVALDAPLAPSPAEADAVLVAAAAHGKIVSVVQPRRWDSDFRTALDAVRSGKLGRLQRAQWIMRQFSPPMPGAMALTSGAGALVDFGAHAFDQLMQLLEGPILSVFAKIRSSRWSDGAEDEFVAWIEFESGASAQVETSLGSFAPLETSWILDGELGGYAGARYYRATEETELVDGALEPLPSDPDGYYAALAHHFRSGGPLPCPAHEGRRVVALMDAIRKSATSGAPLRVRI